MRIKLSSFGFVVTVTFFTVISTVGADENRCEELIVALSTPLPSVNVVKKTATELEQAKEIRPCLETYPWPENVFLMETKEDRAITVEEMQNCGIESLD